MEGQYGQASHILATPANPETPAQMTIRRILKRVSARWRALQETQRAAWITAAQNYRTHARLGQGGPLTGAQLFNKINCTLALFGQEQVDAPPALPQFPDLAPQGPVITNTGGVIALKLTCTGDPGENTIVRGSPPLSAGRDKCANYRILGLCPAPADGAADITALYTARYGAPPGVWTFFAGLSALDRLDRGVSGNDLSAGPHALGR
jgi:hypothetical protein